jgi:hypothetical protein
MAIPRGNVSPISIGASSLPAGNVTANMLPSISENFVFVVTLVTLTLEPCIANEQMIAFYKQGGSSAAAILGAFGGMVAGSGWQTVSLVGDLPCKPGDELYVSNNTSASVGYYAVGGYYWSPE